MQSRHQEYTNPNRFSPCRSLPRRIPDLQVILTRKKSPDSQYSLLACSKDIGPLATCVMGQSIFLCDPSHRLNADSIFDCLGSELSMTVILSLFGLGDRRKRRNAMRPQKDEHHLQLRRKPHKNAYILNIERYIHGATPVYSKVSLRP